MNKNARLNWNGLAKLDLKDLPIGIANQCIEKSRMSDNKPDIMKGELN